jgi:hypothetical protein
VLIDISRARATSAAPGYAQNFYGMRDSVIDVANTAVTDSGSR